MEVEMVDGLLTPEDNTSSIADGLVLLALRGRRTGHGGIWVIQEPGRSFFLPDNTVTGTSVNSSQAMQTRASCGLHRTNTAAAGYSSWRKERRKSELSTLYRRSWGTRSRGPSGGKGQPYYRHAGGKDA